MMTYLYVQHKVYLLRACGPTLTADERSYFYYLLERNSAINEPFVNENKKEKIMCNYLNS